MNFGRRATGYAIGANFSAAVIIEQN